ncbi:MAG: TetR/AcrR family transcriptional regulator [Deltaproteobacteria bacterium]|jgi:TetR/AcrR family transcriptional regulator, hemagglutinin/protease regulatory protein|nr:TetR/AcrR family transcriptional regulator [Deltaproteobacteria bacterium]
MAIDRNFNGRYGQTMPAKTSRSRARPLEQPERKAALLQTAIRVFARRGLGGARHSEIAREAGVSVPTVFFYFPTREVLVRDVLNEVANFYEDMTERIHASNRPAPEVVLAAARAFGDSVVTHPDYACIVLEWSTSIRSELWPLYLQFQEKVVGIVADTVRRWRVETGSPRVKDAENDARVIAVTGYVHAQMKITRVQQSKIDRFLQTVLYDTLGVEGLNLII